MLIYQRVSAWWYSIPSGNPTWLAGKWTIFVGDVPIQTPIHGGFSIAMFDPRRVSSPWMMKFPTRWISRLYCFFVWSQQVSSIQKDATCRWCWQHPPQQLISFCELICTVSTHKPRKIMTNNYIKMLFNTVNCRHSRISVYPTFQGVTFLNGWESLRYVGLGNRPLPPLPWSKSTHPHVTRRHEANVWICGGFVVALDVLRPSK